MYICICIYRRSNLHDFRQQQPATPGKYWPTLAGADARKYLSELASEHLRRWKMTTEKQHWTSPEFGPQTPFGTVKTNQISKIIMRNRQT